VVRRDHGAEVANAVSRGLVLAAHRDGGRRQFVERPLPDPPDESPIPVLGWARERPGTARRRRPRGPGGVSPATPHRRFRARLGTTPLAWLTGQRLELACRLIERGESRFEVVARRSGLGTAVKSAHADAPGDGRHALGLPPPSRPRRRDGRWSDEKAVRFHDEAHRLMHAGHTADRPAPGALRHVRPSWRGRRRQG
jgi:hypothetical protein